MLRGNDSPKRMHALPRILGRVAKQQRFVQVVGRYCLERG